jgi:hypothetical protein
MNLQSCQNCWFNGLQYGSLGLPVGYCSRHLQVLNSADDTTCGLQLRKDLSLQRAREVGEIHRRHYPVHEIVSVVGRKPVNGAASTAAEDIKASRSDPVGAIAFEYGALGSKIESLAMLKNTPGARAEVTLSSLSRGYVANCVARDGPWTSGIHLYWWTRSRLADEPNISASDIRAVGGIPFSRQVALTAWSIVMLRLTLIDDIAEHAASQGHGFGRARGLLRRAAQDVQTFHVTTLARWIRSTALPMLDQRLPERAYVKLANDLHKEELRSGSGSKQGVYG